MEFSLPIVVCFSLASAIFGAGGFYLLTSWRLRKLEDATESIQEIRERLASIETILDYLKERA